LFWGGRFVSGFLFSSSYNVINLRPVIQKRYIYDMDKKVLLMILDGWGIADNPDVSAIDKANTPFIDNLFIKYPHSTLEASGLAVGLPEGQMGNSEVGHMNIGAGRVV